MTGCIVNLKLKRRVGFVLLIIWSVTPPRATRRVVLHSGDIYG